MTNTTETPIITPVSKQYIETLREQSQNCKTFGDVMNVTISVQNRLKEIVNQLESWELYDEFFNLIHHPYFYVDGYYHSVNKFWEILNQNQIEIVIRRCLINNVLTYKFEIILNY